MTYDRRRGRILLFGGMTDAGVSDETWEWVGSGWTPCSLVTRPSARTDAALCYDAARGCAVLFGGRDASGQSLADLWIWSDGAWSPRVTSTASAPAPSARHGAVLVHDATRGIDILFGGHNGASDLGDTWTFDGQNWALVSTSGGPSPRSFAAGFVDDGAGLAMVVGGIGQGVALGDGWSWNGNGWSPVAGQLPVARGRAAACVDLARARLQVFGGNGNDRVLGDTLEATSGSERTMTGQSLLLAGQTASFTYAHPPAAAGNLFFHAISPRLRGATALEIPGLAVVGRLQLDAQFASIAGFGTLGASGAHSWSVPIPFATALTGAGFDFQSLDINQAASTAYLAANDVEATVVFVSQATVPSMVQVSAGSFSMGSTAIGGVSAPVRQVTLTTAFSIGREEVTQAEFLSVMQSNPSFHQGPAYPGSASRPVDSVTWSAAMAYCRALNAIESAAGRVPAGFQYRLPTEAEWEYCCRAGSTTEWHTGITLTCNQANHAPSVFVQCQPGTVAVGSYPANAFGINDMHGNVAEWCLDSWDGTANYASAGTSNPYVSTGSLRILRGGGWRQSPDSCRSANRNTALPTMTSPYIGFRVVLGPILVP